MDSANPHDERSSVRKNADERWEEAMRLLRGETNDSSSDRREASDETPTPAATDADATDAATLELEREQLHAHRKTRERGAVEVHKEVVTEMRTIEVPVRRERVSIEQVPATTESPDERGDAHADPGVTIPVREEEVVIQKRPVVTEEVVVEKAASDQMEHVAEPVKREEARIETSGDVQVSDEH